MTPDLNGLPGVLGVGIDLIEVERIRSSLGQHEERFLDKVFTDREREYCSGMADPAPHYAARFAAKEAIKVTARFRHIERSEEEERRLLRRRFFSRESERPRRLRLSLSRSLSRPPPLRRSLLRDLDAPRFPSPSTFFDLVRARLRDDSLSRPSRSSPSRPRLRLRRLLRSLSSPRVSPMTKPEPRPRRAPSAALGSGSSGTSNS